MQRDGIRVEFRMLFLMLWVDYYFGFSGEKKLKVKGRDRKRHENSTKSESAKEKMNLIVLVHLCVYIGFFHAVSLSICMCV